MLEASRDFSDRRGEIWPMVQSKYLQVHESGDTFVEVTEGTFVAGRFWERSRCSGRSRRTPGQALRVALSVKAAWRCSVPQATGGEVRLGGSP